VHHDLLLVSAIAQGTGQPTDPQIAHIAYTAGQIDIRAAKQALGKCQNKAVKAFAEEMGPGSRSGKQAGPRVAR
jgi:putative membrane protein